MRSGGRSASLPRKAFMFSAAVHAINLAVRERELKEGTQFVIRTDSRSVPAENRNKHIRLCWVSSHEGQSSNFLDFDVEIGGNEEADWTAVAADRRREEYISVHYRDWYLHIQQAIRQMEQPMAKK